MSRSESGRHNLKHRKPLTKQLLFERTLAIIDTEGLNALTMRRLAADVGVRAPSLYNHVSNKEELINGALELMRAGIQAPEPPPDNWMELMDSILSQYGRVLTEHPNMMPFAGRRLEGSNESGATYLTRQGFTATEAAELWQSLVALVVGFAMLGSDYSASETSEPSTELARLLAHWRDETRRSALWAIMRDFENKRSGASP